VVWFWVGIVAKTADDRASELARLFAQVARLSVRAAAEELTRRGVPTPSGGRWHPTQVARVQPVRRFFDQAGPFDPRRRPGVGPLFRK
jgi:hypothetical protein